MGSSPLEWVYIHATSEAMPERAARLLTDRGRTSSSGRRLTLIALSGGAVERAENLLCVFRMSISRFFTQRRFPAATPPSLLRVAAHSQPLTVTSAADRPNPGGASAAAAVETTHSRQREAIFGVPITPPTMPSAPLRPHHPRGQSPSAGSDIRRSSRNEVGLAEDRAQGSAGQLPMHGHHHGAAVALQSKPRPVQDWPLGESG